MDTYTVYLDESNLAKSACQLKKDGHLDRNPSKILSKMLTINGKCFLLPTHISVLLLQVEFLQVRNFSFILNNSNLPYDILTSTLLVEFTN